MHSLFYPKMALSNIYKNRRTYFPYIYMSIFSIMMYYMMNSISSNENVKNMPHAEFVQMLLGVGMWVARIFILIFLFYINSFLIKRRKKEIGLYNILGMEKRHIGIMMFFETLYISAVSIVAGIIIGIVFSKLMFLLLLKLIAADTIPAFDIQFVSIAETCLFFAALFGLTYLYNITKIHLSNTIELLHGGQTGEKEPKTKLILALIGVLCIGAGYYFALVVESPLAAVNFFLIAVILVIIGTYALFTAGSIVLLKLLKKNKKFYYKTEHFLNVSGMIYRMKQNAVGLSNICILSTMVLISISTTVSMYAGMEDSLKKNYPNEINISGSLTDYGISEKIDAEIEKINSSYSVQPKDYGAIHFSTLFAWGDGSGKYTISVNDTSSYTYSSATIILVMELSEFNELSGTDFTLNPGEVLWYSNDKTLAGQNKVEIISDEKTFAYNTRQLSDINSKLSSEQIYNVIKTAIAVVRDKNELESLQKISDMDMSYSVWYDTNLSEDKSMELAEELNGLDIEGAFVTADNRYNVKNELKQMYGSFLFIGMFVGILFSMATALIIYYKQISEGFEDMERFRIMQNVGMSLSEVKKTIRSQVLTVFFLPLAVAAVHVAVSFRIMKMILNILSLGNNSLFIYCTLATLLVFCIIYGIVFKITAKAYYNIVRN